MSKEKELIETLKMLREEGKKWDEVAEEITKAGYKRHTGRAYAPADLCRLLITKYPSMRSTAPYTRRKSASKPMSDDDVDSFKIISAIMNSKELTKAEKLRVIAGLTK